MIYKEELKQSNVYKENYVQGIRDLISRKQQEAAEKRKEYIKNVFADTEKYREDFKKLLGWPLTEARPKELPEVTFTELSKEEGYTIYRAQFKIFDELCMVGLLFKMDGDGAKPMVIAQHGGQGTPESMSGIYGSTTNYNDMLTRIIKYGVHAFAPMVLLWRDNYEVPYDRHAFDARLKRVGSSITAIEIYGIQRIMDYFEAQSYVSNFGMIGLSYGGFYTLFTTAVDTRIRSALSCAFFNTRDAYPWIDWTWFDFADKFDDAEIACLTYPRKLCIAIGDHDELFECKNGERSFERVKEICAGVGTDWVNFIVFEGKHEFIKDDEPIKKLVADIS